MKSFLIKRNTQRIFLDYASTTPLDKDVLKKMLPFFSDKFSNSAGLYEEGVLVKKVIESYREKIARLIHAQTGDIYFTGSGTESNNIALLGLFEQAKKSGIKKPNVIVSNTEHPAILEVAKEIEKRGGSVTYLEVEEDGRVSDDKLKKALSEDTILVSIIYANNEIGSVNSIRALSRIIKKFKQEQNIQKDNFPYFHTDASQAPNYLDCNVDKLGIDMMTLDGHKIYGPKGIGILYKDSHVNISPIIFGGGQEQGLRSGTLNVPAIVGFAEAFIKTCSIREKETSRMKVLQEYFISEIKKIIPQVIINGSVDFRLPNNVNICIPKIDAEFEVINLDEKGIACAYTTACKTLDDASKSYVVEAVSGKKCASSSLRFTFGRNTTKKELTKTLSVLRQIDYVSKMNYND